MNRFYAVPQLVLAIALYIMAFAILVEIVRIVLRPETISVVNAIIGLGVMLISFLALARIVMKKGLASLSRLKEDDAKSTVGRSESHTLP